MLESENSDQCFSPKTTNKSQDKISFPTERELKPLRFTFIHETQNYVSAIQLVQQDLFRVH